MWLLPVALAQDTVLSLDGAVLDDGSLFERVSFDVPPGIAEIEVRHASLNAANFFDWGVDDPDGFRGWGGGNPEPAIVGVDAASRSYLPGPLPAGTWSVIIGKPVMGGPPFDYALEVVLRTEATLPARPRGAYSPVVLKDEARWYAGDFHVHSSESGDADADLDAIAELALARGLDFVVLTEHNTNAGVQRIAEAQARHPDVLLVPGQELTTYAGHAGAIGVLEPLDYRLGLDGATVAGAIAAVHEQGGLFSVNHPNLDLGALCRGCPWEHDVDWDQVDGLEILTGGLDPVGGLFLEANLSLWTELLDVGHRLPILGGSDDHRAGADASPTASPVGNPTTRVLAERLSVEALLEGVRLGRTAVQLRGPDDPRVELGGPESVLEAPHLPVRVSGGEGTSLVWVVDGVRRDPVPVEGDPFELGLEDTPVDTEVRVRVELEEADRTVVLTSPVWFTRQPAEPEPSASGCRGCSGTGGGISLAGWLAWIGVRSRRRRGGSA